MLDLARTHLTGRYLALHNATMVDALRSGVAAGQPPAGTEPQHARPFFAVWADVLATAKHEVTALQGGFEIWLSQ